MLFYPTSMHNIIYQCVVKYSYTESFLLLLYLQGSDIIFCPHLQMTISLTT